jgi:KDO2-lipid IV(A) lauroyltransferase
MTSVASSEPVGERESWRERIAFYAYAAVAWLARVLPTKTGRALFSLVGTAAYHLAPGVRATVATNQAQVIGRPVDDPLVAASTRDAFRLYARYWFDTFDLADWSDADVLEAFPWDGLQYLSEPVGRGQGVIVALPHMGNWDASAPAMRANGLPVVAVAERLRPERLYRLFVRHREALGIEVVGLGERGLSRSLARSLAQGKIVALLADRDLTGRGIPVTMFGRPVRIPAGPALLALSTGAPLVTVAIFQTPTGWRGLVRPLPPIEPTGDKRTDATAIMQLVAAAFERAIAAAPADWHVFQPFWAEDDG